MENQKLIEEYFTADVIERLNNLCDSFTITANNMRADKMMDILLDEGFVEEGCGTNRLCVSHEDDDSVVFKIALDNRGVIDNNVEKYLNEELGDDVPKVYFNTGLICAGAKIHIFSSDEFLEHFEEVMEIIGRLSSEYILDDVGPKSFCNWGIDEETGKVQIADYAYLSRIEDAVMTECEKCGGRLSYTKDFIHFQCDDCDAIYELREVAGDPIDTLAQEGFTMTEEISANDNGDDDRDEFGFLKV